jgi:acyl-CoA hydrolase
MHKHIIFLFITKITIVSAGFAQTNSFDVFTYKPPAFFTKSELPSRAQYNLTNNDTSFCTITLYKSMPAQEDVMKDVISQWNEQVVKRLNKANKKPATIFTEQMWDGWVSTLAIGNFYQHKKKCVVMLHSFRKGNSSTCVVFEMSDKIFKGPVEIFSKNLHLISQP